jgi:hypothetical protein
MTLCERMNYKNPSKPAGFLMHREPLFSSTDPVFKWFLTYSEIDVPSPSPVAENHDTFTNPVHICNRMPNTRSRGIHEDDKVPEDTLSQYSAHKNRRSNEFNRL